MKWKYFFGRDIFVHLVLMVSGQLNETGFIKLGKGTKMGYFQSDLCWLDSLYATVLGLFFFLWWFSDLNVMSEDPKGTSVRTESSFNLENIPSPFAAKNLLTLSVFAWPV